MLTAATSAARAVPLAASLKLLSRRGVGIGMVRFGEWCGVVRRDFCVVWRMVVYLLRVGGGGSGCIFICGEVVHCVITLIGFVLYEVLELVFVSLIIPQTHGACPFTV